MALKEEVDSDRSKIAAQKAVIDWLKNDEKNAGIFHSYLFLPASSFHRLFLVTKLSRHWVLLLTTSHRAFSPP